jgi:hypothetical protein
MPEKPEERSFTTLEELTVSNMYHLEALTELLEEAGITIKEQILERIKVVSGRKQ